MRTFIIGVVLLTAAGCKGGQSASDASASDPVVKAAATANAIKARPAAADSILAAAGYTRDSFQKLMYEIAADSAKSATYAAAKTP
jgi:hypothetical protein